jgi:hypothetical protein
MRQRLRIIGRRLFTDGSERDVFADAESRQSCSPIGDGKGMFSFVLFSSLGQH